MCGSVKFYFTLGAVLPAVVLGLLALETADWALDIFGAVRDCTSWRSDSV